MDISIFTNKEEKPNDDNLYAALGLTNHLWVIIIDFTLHKYPAAIKEWNYSGDKYGWSFRLKDKKRAIIYLLPRDGFFKAAFVFGQKATDQILDSQVSDDIKLEIQNAKVYAEGRGIRIEVKNESLLTDIKKLIEIKLSN